MCLVCLECICPVGTLNDVESSRPDDRGDQPSNRGVVIHDENFYAISGCVGTGLQRPGVRGRMNSGDHIDSPVWNVRFAARARRRSDFGLVFERELQHSVMTSKPELVPDIDPMILDGTEMDRERLGDFLAGLSGGNQRRIRRSVGVRSFRPGCRAASSCVRVRG